MISPEFPECKLELIKARREIARLKRELAKVQEQLELERITYDVVADLLSQTIEVIKR